MRTSRRLLKQVRRAMLAAFLFSGCINLLMLSTPLYTLQVFESVVPLGSIETLVLLTAMTAAAILALALIEIGRDMILLRAGLWLDHELGQHLLENGVKLGVPGQELRRDAVALESFRSYLTSPAVTPLFDAPWVPIFLVALFMLHPMVGGVGLASALLLVAASLSQSLLTRRLTEDKARAGERTGHWWTTVAGNAQLNGALGLARGASAQWEYFNRAHIAAQYSLGKRTSVIKAFGRAVRISSQIAIYGVGAGLVIKGELAPGALVASAILLARALAPLEFLSGSVKATQAALAGYRRLKSLPADAVVPRVTSGEAGLDGHLKLADVTYYHPARKTPALRAVSFELRAGQSLGIVGPNGAGKSTLAAIIGGAISPTTGAADLDGIPIAKWQRGDDAPPVGYMPDEPVLIEGTVHDNIARFCDMSLMAVARAAMRAGVHETIQSLPYGYDTSVGPNGSGLALRERRAVALARALAGSPKLIVLDEPEIGLDGASLRQLIGILKTLKAEGVGLVIATQDPKLLALVDSIVLLNQGVVQMAGPAEDVRRGSQQPAADSVRDRAGAHGP
ncbi:MAG: ATP-binding cassette domain-containing protein [Hyphomicrobium sp.]